MPERNRGMGMAVKPLEDFGQPANCPCHVGERFVVVGRPRTALGSLPDSPSPGEGINQPRSGAFVRGRISDLQQLPNLFLDGNWTSAHVSFVPVPSTVFYII